MMQRILIAGAISLALLGCGGKPPAPEPAAGPQAADNTPTLYDPDGVLKADASDLKSTVVTATLDAPITPGQNVLWCSTFQLAWNELSDLLGGDIRLEGGSPLADSLNQRAATKSDLDEASYVAMAGHPDVVVPKIKKALAEKFPGETFDLAQPSGPSALFAYAALVKNLEFDNAFDTRTDSIMLFGGRPVRSFGFGGGFERMRELISQIVVYAYDGPRKGRREIIIELKTKSPDDRLILAMVAPSATLGETAAAVRSRLGQPVSGEGPESMVDELAVPCLDFRVRRGYRELEGRPIAGIGEPLTDCDQDIHFRLNERGAKLKSEARAGIFGEMAKLIFDRPFLILMERRDAKAPYFALWVDNAELLAPEPPERVALLKRLPFDVVRPFSEGLAAVRLNWKWGYIDTTGRWVVKPQYDIAGDFHDGRARVAIDKGDVPDPLHPVPAASPGGTYEKNGVFTVVDNGPSGSSRFYRHVVNWGYIDRAGKTAIPLGFEYAWAFSDGLARVSVGRDSQGSDDGAEDDIPPVLSSSIFSPDIRAPIEGKRGYIDTSGRVVIPPAYDAARPFKDGVAWVGTMVEGKRKATGVFDEGPAPVWRLIDRRGRTLLSDVDDIGEFSDGLALAKKGDLWGYVNSAGTFVIPAQFEQAGSFAQGHAWATKNGKMGFVDPGGNFSPWLFEEFSFEEDYTDGRMWYEDNATKRCGFADMKGNVVIKPQFVLARPFSEGRAAVMNQESGWGYIDPDGRAVTAFAFEYAERFSEGLAAVEVAGKGWGCIDKSGAFIIEPRFAEIGEFREGFAAVAFRIGTHPLGGPELRWGFVDKSGKMLEIKR